jgi:hypothetical protein
MSQAQIVGFLNTIVEQANADDLEFRNKAIELSRLAKDDDVYNSKKSDTMPVITINKTSAYDRPRFYVTTLGDLRRKHYEVMGDHYGGRRSRRRRTGRRRRRRTGRRRR